jgi:hypothetical protein
MRSRVFWASTSPVRRSSMRSTAANSIIRALFGHPIRPFARHGWGQPSAHRAAHSAGDGALRQVPRFHGLDDSSGGGLGPVGPAMLTLFDFVWRLNGVGPSSDSIEWNCRMPGDATSTTSKWGVAQSQIDPTGSALTLAGKQIAKLRGTARVVTASDGKPLRLIATEPRAVTVLVQIGHRTATHNLNPDSVVAL